jgi:pre-mRNA-splicing factor RBM22/SLT11
MSMTERDQFLGETRIEIPFFEANRDYWAEQANRNVQCH